VVIVAALVMVGCGSSRPTASTSPSASPSPSPSASAASPSPTSTVPTGDLALQVVKAKGHPSCMFVFDKQALSQLDVAFKVTGLSAFPTGAPKVQVFSDAMPGPQTIKWASNGKLAAGQVSAYSFPGSPDVTYYRVSAGETKPYFNGVTVTITVDPKNELLETNENNNVVKLRLVAKQVVPSPDGSTSQCTEVK
jgi:hypothetical protein